MKNKPYHMRYSGIELLKIVAMVLIVISHVVQTLRTENQYIQNTGYVVHLWGAATDFSHFLLALFSYFGALGNSVFFVCSAWFLLDSSKCNKSKWFTMLSEVWVVSVIILVVTLMVRHGNIAGSVILSSLFPTTFANNWYITCYLLFYLIHTHLNSMIRGMSRRQLFRIALGMFLLYCVMDFINEAWFFPSALILWVTVYLVLAYIKLYMQALTENIRFNCMILGVGLTGYIGVAAAADFLARHVPFFSEQVLHWVNNCHPFLLMMAFAMFNLMRKINIRNAVINYISSLSMLIYIIHENIVLRKYFRPAMWKYIYEHYGYDRIIMWVFVLTFVIFVFGLVSACIYDNTVRPFIKKAVNYVYCRVRKTYMRVEDAVTK